MDFDAQFFIGDQLEFNMKGDLTKGKIFIVPGN